VNHESNQSGSEVGGDQVGRDKITHYHLPEDASPSSSIAAYVDQFRSEIEEDSELSRVIDALQHYLESPEGDQPIGVAEKLRRAGREDEIGEAERLKELFSKKLHRRQFSPSAQMVFAALLGEIHQRFRYRVWPLIRQHQPTSAVDSAVFDEVLVPVQQIVDDHEIPLFPQELRGMLFFLTGNCHVSWVSDAVVPPGS